MKQLQRTARRRLATRHRPTPGLNLEIDSKSAIICHSLTRTSRNQNGERGRWRMRRVEVAYPSLTVGALNLVPEFSATLDTNLMM